MTTDQTINISGMDKFSCRKCNKPINEDEDFIFNKETESFFCIDCTEKMEAGFNIRGLTAEEEDYILECGRERDREGDC